MSKDLAKMSSTPGGLSLDVTDISDDQVDDALRQADQARRTAMSMIETLMGSMSGTNDLNGVLDDLLEGFAHEPL